MIRSILYNVIGLTKAVTLDERDLNIIQRMCCQFYSEQFYTVHVLSILF